MGANTCWCCGGLLGACRCGGDDGLGSCPGCGHCQDHCRCVRIDGPARQGEPRFLAALDELARLHAKKQRDYGRDKDPFANVRASAEFGIAPWLGAVVRLNDKVQRLKTFAQKGTLANEGVEDSLLDIAAYALISLVLYRESRPGGR